MLIAIIIAFGAYARFYGIPHPAIPFIYGGDEDIFVGRAVQLLSRKSLDPQWYGHPGQFTIYLLALSYIGFYFLSGVSGAIQGFQSFLESNQYDPTSFYFIGRLISVSFSVGGLILVALIAHRLSKQWATTALAVLLVSVSPILLKFGYAIRPDNQMTFFALVVGLFAIRITEEPRLVYYIYSGLALGVAISCKYPAAVFGIAIITAHVFAYREQFWRRWYEVAASGVAAVVAAFLTAPYLFLNTDGMLAQLTREARPYHLSATSSGPMEASLWYFHHVLLPSSGYLGVVLFLTAVAAAALRLDMGRFVLATTAIVFFFFIVNLNLHWDRWLIPFMPLYLTLIALGVQDVARQLEWATGRTSIAVVASAVICVILLTFPYATIQAASSSSEKVVKVYLNAYNWTLANAPENSAIVLELGGLELPREKYRLWQVRGGTLVPLVSKRRFVPPSGRVGKLVDLREIEAKGINYVVLSGFYDRYKAEPEAHPDNKKALARYEELIRKYPVVFQERSIRILRVE